MSDAPLVLVGRAYGHRATLSIAGDTLTWRAQRDGAPENIATTVHDVRRAAHVDLRLSRGGLVLVALGALWAASENALHGSFAIAAGLALLAWRALAPRHYLMLEVGDRRLVLTTQNTSAAPSRALATRIQRTLESGEVPLQPPTLP